MSFNFIFSFFAIKENKSPSVVILLIGASSSFGISNSCSKAIICNFVLKNIYWFLILNKFYSLSTLWSENSFKLTNYVYISSAEICSFNLLISPSHLSANLRNLNYLASFYLRKASKVLVLSPLISIETPLLMSSFMKRVVDVFFNISGLM